MFIERYAHAACEKFSGHATIGQRASNADSQITGQQGAQNALVIVHEAQEQICLAVCQQ